MSEGSVYLSWGVAVEDVVDEDIGALRGGGDVEGDLGVVCDGIGCGRGVDAVEVDEEVNRSVADGVTEDGLPVVDLGEVGSI